MKSTSEKVQHPASNIHDIRLPRWDPLRYQQPVKPTIPIEELTRSPSKTRRAADLQQTDVGDQPTLG